MKALLPLLAMLALLSACRSESEAPSGRSDGIYLNMDPSVEFVGKETCRSCHMDRYDTYILSEMGRSFKPARLSNSAARFEGIKPVYDATKDLYYLPFAKGDELFVTEYRLANRDTVYKRTEKIDYIVGSGHHTNSHMREENGYVYQIPVTWYVQEGRWDLPPGFHNGNNARFDRAIQLECMTCHNARPTFVQGSENRFSMIPHGIDCESCHGPGELHTREMLAGNTVDTSKAIDYTIVNPRHLPLERQFDVCQRCHMQGAAVTAEGKTFLDFRPGADLSEYLNVYWPRSADSVRSFIMASHPDRLRMSACFRETWKESSDLEPMTCITCHNPHVSVKSMGEDGYNQTCRSCHQPEKSVVCTEEMSVRSRNGDNCFACHMPMSGSADIPHVKITDHYIRTPDRLDQVEVEAQKKFFGLASLVKKRPNDREIADGYLTYFEQFEGRPYFLDSADTFITRALRSNEPADMTSTLVRLRFLQGRYQDVAALSGNLEKGGRDAWTVYRIGESYLKLGNTSEAIRYLEAAVNAAPQHLRFLSRLANAYASARRTADAEGVLNSIIQLDPTFSSAYNDRGFVRILQGNLETAENDFKAALRLDPDATQALANLASLYLNTNRPDEARRYARRLIALDPQNQEYRKLLDYLQ